MTFSIPKEVLRVTDALRDAKFEAYLVGGCVRDMLMKRRPKDWDVTTNAAPEDILKLFGEDAFYNNTFGTVGVTCETEDETTKVVEVTPYRTESTYSDKRRPDSVSFSKNLEEDLARRDFTINAIAYEPYKGHIEDPYRGQKDIKDKTIRAVGDPHERFDEDALRIMRAIRLSAELDFVIEAETMTAIQKHAGGLGNISRERIRDEFVRVLQSKSPMQALFMAQKLGVLSYIAPDLERGIGVEQNKAHSYDVFEHNMRTMQHAADKDWPFDIRLAALFHDISKPETRRWSDEKKTWTFYGHDVVGARVTKKALESLKFPKKTIEKTVSLVRWHMFFSDPDLVTLSAVRRVVRNVGEENIWDLLNLRICDRIGTGRPKEQPFRFRKYKSMVDEALRDPISVKMLKIDGKVLMGEFHMKPGPKIGYLLAALLEEVIEDSKKNTREKLLKRAGELEKMPMDQLRKISEAAKERVRKEEEEAIKNIRKMHHVCDC
jgi:putative nucleotidyltransferase with HDIG domain